MAASSDSLAADPDGESTAASTLAAQGGDVPLELLSSLAVAGSRMSSVQQNVSYRAKHMSGERAPVACLRGSPPDMPNVPTIRWLFGHSSSLKLASQSLRLSSFSVASRTMATTTHASLTPVTTKSENASYLVAGRSVVVLTEICVFLQVPPLR